MSAAVPRTAPSIAPFLDTASRAALRSAALSWWAANGRPLNFRRSRDPYGVLVSEVIAQQTQIARVEPAWASFMARFPTVQALAAATSADVLRQWRGLGYNRRALNLWRTARIVVAERGGTFPPDVEALARLPGIGPYTARAVAAIAFGMRVGAVDTNVRRVLGRAILGEAEAAPGPRLQSLADDMVPPDRAGEWTHALMDIGATFCRPTTPRCDGCPAAGLCRFRSQSGGTVSLPSRRRETGAATTAARPSTARRVPFRDTTRWLRGRLLDRARSTPGDDWFEVEGPLGSHDAAAVGAAVRTLGAEGLLELHPLIANLARLPR